MSETKNQRTQNDLVAAHLQTMGIGEVVEDKLKIPLINQVFQVQRNPKLKPQERLTESIRLPLIAPAKNSTREELSQAFQACLEYRPDVVGLSWDVGSDQVKVIREPGAKAKLGEGYTNEDIFVVFGNILKSRALLQSFTWEFGSPFVKVVYENSQFA